MTPHLLIWIAVITPILIVSLWDGGPDERAAAIAMLVAWLATGFFENHDWLRPQYEVLVVDAALLLALAAIALRTDRYWPLFAAGFQLLGLVTHAARVVDTTVDAWVYITAGVIWSYLVVFALAVGAWGCWRQNRQLTKPTGGEDMAGDTRR